MRLLLSNRGARSGGLEGEDDELGDPALRQREVEAERQRIGEPRLVVRAGHLGHDEAATFVDLRLGHSVTPYGPRLPPSRPARGMVHMPARNGAGAHRISARISATKSMKTLTLVAATVLLEKNPRTMLSPGPGTPSAPNE